jgi:anaphase-promoting complex subunit 5
MANTRYLTPHKIGLLVLANLYCKSAISSSSVVPVLAFILSHSIPPAFCHARTSTTVQHDTAGPSIQTLEDVLQTNSSTMPGRTLLDVFLKCLWEINSFDALDNLFAEIYDLFQPSKDDPESENLSTDRIYLSKTSPLGAFVRKARLEFVRLQFDDALKLWDAFIAYRAPTAQWTKRLAGLSASGVDINAANMALEPGDALFRVAYPELHEEVVGEPLLSVDDVEHLLDFQLQRMQSACNM